jgi:hypothetical protein
MGNIIMFLLNYIFILKTLIQQRTRENDIYKNILVESSDWTLIRIWEDEIRNFDFNKL